MSNRIFVLLLALFAGLGVALSQAKPATADPTFNDAQREVATLAEKMAVKNEEINRIRDELAASKAKQAQLETELSGVQKQYRELQSTVGDLGAAAYSQGSFSIMNALLDASSAQALLDSLSYLEVLTNEQRQTVDSLTTARNELNGTKSKVDKEVASQSENEHKLVEEKDALQKELTKWEDLRDKLGPQTYSTSRATYSGQATGKAAIAVKFAYAQLGKTYEFGAAGPNSYDCSGLTMAAWRQAGVYLSHASKNQYYEVPTKVSRANLQPGDLVVFYSDLHHVGIYIGNGQLIHASQPSEPIKIASVSTMPYYGGVRPG